jgi:Alpha-L-arabinofuranosidase
MIKYKINPLAKKGKINKEIYGNFSEHLGRCIYEGIYVGKDSEIPNVNGMRKDVVEALKNIKLPVLRWPGGCFADEYHWMDGIGPKENRKKMVNTHWGGVVEDNSFGTHEFLELCDQIGCQPYVNGNLGSGTVQEMSEWVEYMTFDGLSPMSSLREQNGRKEPWKVSYFGVGNENWGCGGNMTPEYYANEYRRYQTYCREYGSNKLYKIACGPNSDNYEWTETLMKNAKGYMSGLSLHHYTLPTGNWSDKGDAVNFNIDDWYATLKNTLFMEELVTKHAAIMDKYDPDKKVGLIVDEWGSWYNVEAGTNPGFLYQQNTIRDALIAGINLDIFNKHCDRVKMANIAQLVNVLQSLILTEGAAMVLTPTYYVFKMYQYHQEGTLLDSFIETKEIGSGKNQVPNLHESVSEDEFGNLHITINNLSADEAYEIETEIMEYTVKSVDAEIVTGKMNDYNNFQEEEKVTLQKSESYKIENGKVIFTIPACSVMHLTMKR